jgi:hypothetical protein
MVSFGFGNSRAVLAALLALSLAGGVGAWLRARAAGERIAALEEQLASVQDRVTADAAERGALAAQVARLEAALAAATAAAAAARPDATPTKPAPHGASAPVADEIAANEAEPDAPDLDAAAPHGAVSVFSADRLIAAGFRREDVARFRARLDEIELKRLYLRDQATREGWLETPRFAEESESLTGEFLGLRREFDEPLYDWALYSTGHPNRVAIRDVISGGAGESAGLQRGDVIVRYDDRLVLSAEELRDATTQGRVGELVALEVQRDGETAPRRIFVPRGPIGINLAPTALQPPPAG